MHPEIEVMFDRAAPTPERGPDIDRIIAGGRRLHTLRRVHRTAATLACVAMIAVAAPAVLDRWGDRATEPDRIAAAAPREAAGPKEPFRESTPSQGPAYVDRVRGEEKYLTGKKEIVASGTVMDLPWSLVEMRTTYAEGRGGEPDLCTEFFLGKDGIFGGGGACAAPTRDGSLVTLTGHYWGDVPDLVAIVGSIAEPAVSARVELEDGRTRPLEILPSSKDDNVGWYVFFPPPFERGRVVAFDAAGNEVGRRPICFPLSPDGSVKMEAPQQGSVTSCSQ